MLRFCFRFVFTKEKSPEGLHASGKLRLQRQAALPCLYGMEGPKIFFQKVSINLRPLISSGGLHRRGTAPENDFKRLLSRDISLHCYGIIQENLDLLSFVPYYKAKKAIPTRGEIS